MNLTVFSSPKPFVDEHISRIQRNAIRSWQHLGSGVEVLLLGDEQGAAQVASELGIEHIQDVRRNELGTPLLSSIFERAQAVSKSDLMLFVNADILLLPEMLDFGIRLQQRLPRFLAVGSRIDLEVKDELLFADDWPAGFISRVQSQGRQHQPAGSDYFLFRRGQLFELPPFALGRAGWDNWMIYAGRRAGIPVVDASDAVRIVHQDHDYRHLPGGQPHYRHPESRQNVELAGGVEMIFTLRDTDWIATGEVVRRRPARLADIGRRVETRLYVLFGPGRFSHAAWLLFHPVQFLRYFISRVKQERT